MPLVVAMWYGVGPITDAWYWALAFPTFALVLASTSLGTATAPAMARVKAEDPARLPSFVGGIFCWTATGALALGLIICLAAPLALRHVTGFDPPTRALAALYLWELLPFMVLTSASSVLRVGNELDGGFIGVAVTPLLRASAVIGATLALQGLIGPHALPWGLVTGELVQMGWWGLQLRRRGLRLRLGFTLDPAIRQVGRDLAPILGGEVLVAMNLVIDKAFAAQLESGSVATMEYADRARVIPQTLLESTLLMVSYASWSTLRAAGRAAEARLAVDQALRWTLSLAAPVLAGMFIGRVVLIQLLYERGAFTMEDTADTARVLGWFLPGVLPNLLGILAVRAHVVERNLRLVFGLGLLSVLLNVSLNLVLMRRMGIDGLALSTTLVTVVISGLYLWRLGLGQRFPLRPWLRALGGALAAALVAAGVELAHGPPTHLFDPWLWGAALPCLALLAIAARAPRPGASP